MLMSSIISPLSDVSPGHQEILKEYIEINIGRERILGFLLIVVVGALYLIDTFSTVISGKNTIYGHFSVLHLLLVTVTIMYLLYVNLLSGRLTNWFRLIHISFIFCILSLSSIMSGINITLTRQPLTYITAMFCIAPLILLKPLERYATYILSCLFYVCIIMYKSQKHAEEFREIFFITLMVTLACIVSSINYNILYRICAKKRL